MTAGVSLAYTERNKKKRMSVLFWGNSFEEKH